MMPTPLDEIRRAVHGRWMTAPAVEPVTIRQVGIDSRTAGAGDLFIAIRGERFDGHDFLAAAAKAGCAAAIVTAGTDIWPELAAQLPGGVIGVDDTTVALGELAAMHRSRLAGQVIAVTGSVGKTTVKAMIHHILRRRWNGTVAPASFNNHVGVPLTLLAAGAGDDYVVCELGSSAPGEIAALTRIAKPDLAVITAVGPSHLEHLGSIERVAAEKAAILAHLAAGRGAAVVWADSEELTGSLRAYDARLIRFGAADDADLRLADWFGDGLSQRFTVNGRTPVTLNLPGRHHALNALAAIAVAVRLGLEVADAAAALADFEAVAMRTQVQRFGDVTVINDAYNANPMSMAAALEVLVAQTALRRVFVAGDMLELGEQSTQLHTQLGRRIARSSVGLLVAIGSQAEYIARAAAEANRTGLEVIHYPSADEAGRAVNTWLTAGDMVLVKASRAVGAECVVEAIGRAMKSKPAHRTAETATHRQTSGRTSGPKPRTTRPTE